jgi:hypothetical protein
MHNISYPLSWPGLSRPSTSSELHHDLDDRQEAGHDERKTKV